MADGPGFEPADSARVRLSKTLSWLLRHNAAAQGLALRPDGYARLADVLANPRVRAAGGDEEAMERVVAGCDKQRFSLMEQDGVRWIRANQGHSGAVGAVLQDEAMLTPVTTAADAPVCVHGTDWAAWRLIEVSVELRTMARRHVHFAPGLPGASGVISGMRVNCDVLLYLDVPRALAAGLPLYRSANGVLLSPGLGDTKAVPLALLSEVVAVRDGKTGELLPQPHRLWAPAASNTGSCSD